MARPGPGKWQRAVLDLGPGEFSFTMIVMLFGAKTRSERMALRTALHRMERKGWLIQRRCGPERLWHRVEAAVMASSDRNAAE
jgi:DNA-binding transcriptional regulator PaaX